MSMGNVDIEIEEKRYDIQYKISFIDEDKGKRIVNIKPEYENLKNISQSLGVPVKVIIFYAQAEIKKIYEQYSQKKG